MAKAAGQKPALLRGCQVLSHKKHCTESCNITLLHPCQQDVCSTACMSMQGFCPGQLQGGAHLSRRTASVRSTGMSFCTFSPQAYMALMMATRVS